MKSRMLILGLMTLCSLSSYAGKETGNSGLFVMLGNQRVVADPFAKAAGTTKEYRLSKQAISYFEELKKLVTIYGIDAPELWSNILGAPAEYFFVKDLPSVCTDKFETTLTSGAELTEYGCTIEGVTYLDEDHFPSSDSENSNISFKEQMFALLHERLHAARPEVGHATHHRIAGFVSALKELVAVYEQERDGAEVILTDEQIENISDLYRRAKQLNFKVGNECVILKNGGGCSNSESKADENSYVEVGSIISQQTELNNCKITGISQIMRGVCSNSKISSSTVVAAKLSESNISSSTIADGNYKKIISDRSSVRSSLLESFEIINSVLYAVEGTNSKIIDSNITALKVNDSSFSSCYAGKGTYSQSVCINTVIDNSLANFTLDNAEISDSKLNTSARLSFVINGGAKVHGLTINTTEGRQSKLPQLRYRFPHNVITISGTGAFDFSGYGFWTLDLERSLLKKDALSYPSAEVMYKELAH